MSKSTKVTYKELNDRIAMAFNKLAELHKNIDYVHTLVMKYIAFNEDEDKFLEFVKGEREKVEKKVREDERKIEQSKG